MKSARAAVVSRRGVTANDNYGVDVGYLDRIDSIAFQAYTNPVVVQFAPPIQSGNAYDWSRSDEVYIPTGVVTGFDKGDLSGFSHWRVKRATTGLAATYDVTASCRGGNPPA